MAFVHVGYCINLSFSEDILAGDRNGQLRMQDSKTQMINAKTSQQNSEKFL